MGGGTESGLGTKGDCTELSWDAAHPVCTSHGEGTGMRHDLRTNGLRLGEHLFILQILEVKLGAQRESLFSGGRAGTCNKQEKQQPSLGQSCGLRAVTSGDCCLGSTVAESQVPPSLY